MAVAAADVLSEAYDRHGQRLVFWRRIHAAGVVRSSIAAEEATFGLSEINWGIIPGGVVTRAVAAKMNQADALYYIMTGETFDGKKAAQMGLVNEAVPLADLRDRMRALAEALLQKNPTVLRTA